jgi:hypothetical protein
MKLKSSEISLIGKWILKEGQIIADDTCQRIELLLTMHLVELGTDSSGWNVLYRDPCDGRLWELSYSDSSCQGGGAPQLCCLKFEEAKKKYTTIDFEKE